MRKRISNQLLKVIIAGLYELRREKFERFNRHVSVGDLLFDREDTSRFYGFGEGTTCYNNVLILGEVSVGKNTWIGPNVVLDGSGGLEIGEFVSISAGVQIYSHTTVARSTTKGSQPIEKISTKIGNGVYIGPNAIIQMGVNVGDGAVIGALSLVNCDVPAGAKAFGSPIRIIATK